MRCRVARMFPAAIAADMERQFWGLLQAMDGPAAAGTEGWLRTVRSLW